MRCWCLFVENSLDEELGPRGWNMVCVLHRTPLHPIACRKPVMGDICAAHIILF